MCANHKPLQRKDIHILVVLVRLHSLDKHSELYQVAVPVAVLARASAICPETATSL